MKLRTVEIVRGEPYVFFKADWQAQTLGVHLKSKYGHMVESFYDEDEWGVLWRIRFLTNKELNWGWALRMTTNQDLR